MQTSTTPPPDIITGINSKLDQDASTLLFPSIETEKKQMLLENGDFSQHDLADDSKTDKTLPGDNSKPRIWHTYRGIPGWAPIEGGLVEIQKRDANYVGKQCCELDAHWEQINGVKTFAHGIQQTAILKPGYHYALIFDYRAREMKDNKVQETKFSVKAKAIGGKEHTLVEEHKAAQQWKRAVVTFGYESDGEPENSAVTFKFDIVGQANTFGVYIDNVMLLPLDFQTTDITRGFDYPIFDDSSDINAVNPKVPLVKDQDNPEWWSSVARANKTESGLDVNNHVKLVFGSEAAAKLCEIRSSNDKLLTVSGDGVGKTGNLTKATTLLTITGHNPDKPELTGIKMVDVEVCTRDKSHLVLLTLKVLVMPERKVRLRVHFVEDHTVNLGQPNNPVFASAIPVAYQDVAGIVNKLNEVYRQNCLTFVADEGSGPLDLRGWDFNDLDDKLNDTGKPNGILEDKKLVINNSAVPPSLDVVFETRYVEASIKLKPKTLHLLVFKEIKLGKAAGFWTSKFMPNCVFVGAINHENSKLLPPLLPLNQQQAKACFLITCAHEIGHALSLSVRHALDSDGKVTKNHDPEYFPEDYDTESLMKNTSNPLRLKDTWLRHEEWIPAWKNTSEYEIR